MDIGMAAEVHFGGHDLSFDPGEYTWLPFPYQVWQS